MTTGINVTYDITTLNPTPLVNYTKQPITFGYVYGHTSDITLEGLYTGITTTGDAISYLTGVFANQFKTLAVVDSAGSDLYRWSGVTVDSISFDTSKFFQGSFVRYTIKLRAYDLPSGVIEPSNEYGFAQNEDGTVNVSHKIMARGIRNQAGAFDNAIAFVKQFTGKNPFNYCAPFFVPNGSGILMSVSENINRAEGIYSVTESYKYNTGSSSPYIKTTSLDVADSIDAEYRTIDYGVRIQGSPINKNLSDIIANYLNYDVLAEIQTEFGFSTTNWVKSSYSSNIDSGSAMIDIKIGYVSGASPSGYFDYEVSMEKDILSNIETWKIDGDFQCYGPLDYRLKQIQNFKSNSTNAWRPYLTGLIASSPLYSGEHDSSKMFSQNLRVDVSENPNLAVLKLTLSMDAGYEPSGLSDLKYNVECSPSRWIYELMPSATIEGSYVIQDLQTASQARQKFSLSTKSNNKTSAISTMWGYVDSLTQNYVNSGTMNDVKAFEVESVETTGVYEAAVTSSWLGADSGISSGLLQLQSVGSSQGAAPLRQPNFRFGY